MIKVGVVQVPSHIYLRHDDGHNRDFNKNEFGYTTFEVSRERAYDQGYSAHYPTSDEGENADSYFIEKRDNFLDVLENVGHLIPLPNQELIHETIRDYGQLKIYYETIDEARASLKL